MPLLWALTRVVLWLIALIPFPLLYLVSDLAFLLVYYVAGYRKQVVRQNLAGAFPEKTPAELLHIEKAFFRYLCDLNLEVLKIPVMTASRLRKRVHFTNAGLLEQYANKHMSLIAVTAHAGNWEWGGLALSEVASSYKIIGVYKPLNNPRFDSYFREMRGKFGMELVPMKSTLRAILKNRGLISITSLLSDQTPTIGETEFVYNFMNRPVPVFLGAEKIARLTKYPVIYLAMRRIRRGYYEVEIIPVSDTPEQDPLYSITKKHLALLELEIRNQPASWLWSHRRWKHAEKSWPESVVVG